MPTEDNGLEEFEDVSPYAQAFQDWLIEYTVELGRTGPDVIDLTIIMLNCMAKMRAVLLPEELKGAVVNAVQYMEERIEGTGAILAEHWRHLDGGYELYQATQTAVAPDDLSGLAHALPDDFDLRD